VLLQRLEQDALRAGCAHGRVEDLFLGGNVHAEVVSNVTQQRQQPGIVRGRFPQLLHALLKIAVLLRQEFDHVHGVAPVMHCSRLAGGVPTG
jgi:hypothetical protein